MVSDWAGFSPTPSGQSGCSLHIDVYRRHTVDIVRPGFSVITSDTPFNTSAQVVIAGATAAETVDLDCQYTSDLIVTHLIEQRYAAISTIEVSSNVVTVVTTANHGFSTDDVVIIADVYPTDFNGTYTITVSNDTTFTYALTLANQTGSGGTCHVAAAGFVSLYQLLQTEIISVSKNLSVVTVTTKRAHNLAVGESITIAGIDPSDYNGSFTITSVPTATTFTYSI
jgi:hypothetical protein